MIEKQPPPLPQIGALIRSACGGQMNFELDTPKSLFKERWIYFCLSSCREDFEKDSTSSCLSPDEITGIKG
jgi:hypothetical protein